jgi:hypothetical protein
MAIVPTPERLGADLDRRRRRAMIATAAFGVASVALLVDLLMVGHTTGEQIWGPVTAALASGVAAMSLIYLSSRARSQVARIALIGLWLLVAFFGYGGYNDHRAADGPGSVDPRPRPPLAPLVFTGLGLAAAYSLRYGTKGA